MALEHIIIPVYVLSCKLSLSIVLDLKNFRQLVRGHKTSKRGKQDCTHLFHLNVNNCLKRFQCYPLVLLLPKLFDFERT